MGHFPFLSGQGWWAPLSWQARNDDSGGRADDKEQFDVASLEVGHGDARGDSRLLRVLGGVCERHQARKVDASYLVMGGTRRAGRNDAAGTVRSMTERSPMAEYAMLGVVRTSPYRRLAEALAPAEKA